MVKVNTDESLASQLANYPMFYWGEKSPDLPELNDLDQPPLNTYFGIAWPMLAC